MAKKSNAERCREYRLRKKAEKAAAGKTLARALTASVAADAAEQRRAAARARYAEVKAKGGAEYRRVLEAARKRAAAYNARRKAAAKKAAR